MDEIAELRADVAFLLLRAGSAGSCNFAPGRWTGMSSNAIVSVAYGGAQTALPSDRADWSACVLTFRRLPEHRKTAAVRKAMRAAREAYLSRYPTDRFPATRRAERERYAEDCRTYEAEKRARRQSRQRGKVRA